MAADDSSFRLAPGGTIGIIGGGQLGRMTALAAARLGYGCHVFTPEAHSPAAQVCAAATVADYADRAALEHFARSVGVITFEFENIPHESVRLMAEIAPVRPKWRSLHIAQDRLLEKDFLNRIPVRTTAWREVTGPESLAEAAAALGLPAVLKTARMGYDGKGQVMIRPEGGSGGADFAAAWRAMGAERGILEAFVDYRRELSVVLARGGDGAVAAFDVVENRHAGHILDTTVAPAILSEDAVRQAVSMAENIARSLDLVGLLAVELFERQDGSLLVNEIAPRPHNSGHWTMDACVTSQFEQFVRAVCGLPLGSPRRHSDAIMQNLIGDAVGRWEDLIADPGAKLHLYGKAEARPGRKMGHVTWLKPLSS